MIRYQFLPEQRENGHIAVVVGDPTDVLKLDELELLLGAAAEVKVGVAARRSARTCRSPSRRSACSTRPPKASASSSSARTRTAKRR